MAVACRTSRAKTDDDHIVFDWILQSHVLQTDADAIFCYAKLHFIPSSKAFSNVENCADGIHR